MDAKKFVDIMKAVEYFIQEEDIKEELYSALSDAKNRIENDTVNEMGKILATNYSDEMKRATILGLCK